MDFDLSSGVSGSIDKYSDEMLSNLENTDSAMLPTEDPTWLWVILDPLSDIVIVFGVHCALSKHRLILQN